MIPKKTIQDILDATRIEEVVEDFVALKRRGVNLIGLCPFHNERSPSFNVNPVRNIFKCFGCGKGGDAVTFLMEAESMTYPDAIRWLGKKYRIEIEETKPSPEAMLEAQVAESLHIVNEFAQKTYVEQLFETDLGRNVGLDYLKNRGFTEDTIRKWGIGWAPDSRDFLIKKATGAGYNLELLKKLGLANSSGQYDFFRGRVIFPIHSVAGKVAAFTARVIGKSDGPKYINSPETEVFSKSKTLFGFHLAKKMIRQLDECLLAEGQADVISLHQAGFENAVASSGTSLTVEQILLIKRNTQNIKILYDGDAAGIKAALRGMDLILENDVNVKVVLLPDGQDPDSMIQSSGAAFFKEFIDNNAADFIVFKTRLLLDEAKNDPVKRASLTKDIVSTIARVQDPIKRSFYQKECSALMQISEEILVNETKKIISTGIRKAEEKAARQPTSASDSPPPAFDRGGPYPFFPTEEHHFGDPLDAPQNLSTDSRNDLRVGTDGSFQEKDIIRILIQFGAQILQNERVTVAEFILGDIEELLGEFENPTYGKIAQEAHALLVAKTPIHQNHFLTHSDPKIAQLTINLLASPFEYSPNWTDEKRDSPLRNQPAPELNFGDDAISALQHFKLRKIIKMCETNQQRIRAADQSGDVDSLMRFMKIQQKLIQTRNELAKKTGTVVFK